MLGREVKAPSRCPCAILKVAHCSADDSSFTALLTFTRCPCYSPPNRPNASGVDHPWRAALLRPSCERCRETEVVGSIGFFQSWNTGRAQTQRYTCLFTVAMLWNTQMDTDFRELQKTASQHFIGISEKQMNPADLSLSWSDSACTCRSWWSEDKDVWTPSVLRPPRPAGPNHPNTVHCWRRSHPLRGGRTSSPK